MGEEKAATDRAAFLGEMGQLYDSMFAAERQPELVTFEQREQRVWEIGQIAQKRLLELHLARDPGANGAVEVTCPLCGSGGARKEGKRKRKVQARPGEVGWERDEYYCRQCRRHFSPSRSVVEGRERGV
jgi:hypothetical protein